MKSSFPKPKDFPLLFLVLVISVVWAPGVQGQEWTRFRGPNGTGVGQARNIPAQWSKADFNWKVELPAPGHSSPVLWGEKIFLTGGEAEPGRIVVFCVDAKDGRILWQRDFPLTAYRKHNYNTFSSGSAAVDAERVYASWTMPSRYALVALDHSGKLVWENDLGPFKSQHGGGTSPIVYEGSVVLGNEQDGDSFIICVDAATGRTRWKTARSTKEVAYSTPCVFRGRDGKDVLIFSSEAHGLTALEPSTGSVVWELNGLFDKRVVSSPVAAGGLIIGSCGSGGGGKYVVAVEPGAPEKAPKQAYSIKRSAPYVPTSISVGELLFLWTDGGIVSCVQAASGDIKWQERVGGNFFGSPVFADSKLFCVSTRGEVVAIAASDKFQVLGRTQLDETCHSTPGVAGGRVYVRTIKHLFSVGGGGPRE